LRELKHDPAQQAASEYMNFLASPGAEDQLVANDFALLWRFLTTKFVTTDSSGWLTETLRDRYREVWSHGLRGGCNYYRASPMRPPTIQDPAAAALDLPRGMLVIEVPTMVVWGLQDAALPPALVDGLEDFVPQLILHKVPDATHWILHEQPALCIELLTAQLKQGAQNLSSA
jgi:pimeloyl-ACP methyl ester carboxylesterase